MALKMLGKSDEINFEVLELFPYFGYIYEYASFLIRILFNHMFSEYLISCFELF